MMSFNQQSYLIILNLIIKVIQYWLWVIENKLKHLFIYGLCISGFHGNSDSFDWFILLQNYG